MQKKESEIKSFQLFKANPPTRFAADYSESEKEIFRAEFKVLATRYRRISRVVLLCFATTFVSAIWKSVPFLNILGIVAAIGFLGILFYRGSGVHFLCPGCHNRLEVRFGAFCPECGEKLLAGGFWKPFICSSCKRELRKGGKSRGYNIRACTHCGVVLGDNDVYL